METLSFVTDRGADSRLLSTSENEIRQRELADRIREGEELCSPFNVITANGSFHSQCQPHCPRGATECKRSPDA
jgi:hypothetical protein